MLQQGRCVRLIYLTPTHTTESRQGVPLPHIPQSRHPNNELKMVESLGNGRKNPIREPFLVDFLSLFFCAGQGFGASEDVRRVNPISLLGYVFS